MEDYILREGASHGSGIESSSENLAYKSGAVCQQQVTEIVYGNGDADAAEGGKGGTIASSAPVSVGRTAGTFRSPGADGATQITGGTVDDVYACAIREIDVLRTIHGDLGVASADARGTDIQLRCGAFAGRPGALNGIHSSNHRSDAPIVGTDDIRHGSAADVEDANRAVHVVAEDRVAVLIDTDARDCRGAGRLAGLEEEASVAQRVGRLNGRGSRTACLSRCSWDVVCRASTRSVGTEGPKNRIDVAFVRRVLRIHVDDGEERIGQAVVACRTENHAIAVASGVGDVDVAEFVRLGVACTVHAS